MASDKVKIIQSRLGEREVRLDKVIHFPCGIIGFEDAHEFTLLEVQENSPLLVLQSLEEPTLGLLVADPFAFLPDYSMTISDAEQQSLQAKGPQDLAVLVTVTIPPGKPEDMALNLLGPIVLNHQARLGLQSPQMHTDTAPAKLRIPLRPSRDGSALP